jgi:hypothetical protein
VLSGRPADVEEAFETTEAFCAARSIDSSRVSRLTCQRLLAACLIVCHMKLQSGTYQNALLQHFQCCTYASRKTIARK